MWFWAFYGALIAAVIAWGIFLRVRWRNVPVLADIVYDERIKSGELPKKVQRGDFTSAFIDAESPRKETYRWATSALSLTFLPILVRLFNIIWGRVWVLSGKPPVFEAGYMLHTFCTFLFAMGVIIAMLYYSMRHYYKNAPDSLRKQIRELIGESA